MGATDSLVGFRRSSPMRLLRCLLTVAVWLGCSRPAFAGMPILLLSDLARMRLQVISFFLLVLLLCAKLVQRIWNALRNDFPKLPLLTYGKSLGLVTLWGLLFLLVLTMISGARELMTPGAWKKQGLTYALADGVENADSPSARQAEREGNPADPETHRARRDGLVRLSVALWTYAQTHDGRFPPSGRAPEIAEPLWQVPDSLGLRYIYVPGLKRDEGSFPLAYDPGLHGPERWVLLTDGEIRLMTLAQIRPALKPVQDLPKPPAQANGGENR